MSGSVLDAVIAILQESGSQAAPDQDLPSVILWPDPEEHFRALVARLHSRLTVLTLGPYDSSAQTGPAIWVRCALADRLSEPVSDEGVPIVYLPGFGRESLREIAEAPPELQPLAELQFRGVVFGYKGRDWTVATLLANGGGLRLRLGKDTASKSALFRAFSRLLDEPVNGLLQAGELDAQFLDGLLTPDPVRTLLEWVNDPEGVSAALGSAEWNAFASMGKATYRFDPEKDGPITAARQLGERKGAWAQVWNRFLEAPERYPGVPNRLVAAQPEGLLFENRDSWPQLNAEDETALRTALTKLAGLPPGDAGRRIRELEASHGVRRSWVWAQLKQAPLARALEHLTELADGIGHPPPNGTPEDLGRWYSEEGWSVDAAAMKALASVDAVEDVRAVEIAVATLYGDWLDRGARALQLAFAAGIPEAGSEVGTPPGTCLLFVDGLRLDIAHSVAAALAGRARVDVQWRFAAVPTITPTSKPSVSPVAGKLFAGSQLAPSTKEGGPALSAEAFRKVLADQGWQYIGDGGWGDPQGRAWAEGGDIDVQGHALATKFPRRLAGEVDQIVEHTIALLGFGWRRVVIVTDHGWLYLPGGLPKVEMPIHTTDVRKGRCARVADGANVKIPTYPWRWDPLVRVAGAPGIACFEAGKVYEHGGISPQESITPRVVVELLAESPLSAQVRITMAKWVGLRCRIETPGAPPGATADIRRKPADEVSSLVAATKPIIDGSCSLVIADDSNEGHAAVVVVLSADGVVIAQRLTTVGGETES